MGDRRLERRKFVRFDLDANVRYKIAGNANVNESLKGKAKNVSGEGLCIASEKEIPRDRDIELDISLPGKKTPVRVHGQVVWTHRIKGADKNKTDHFESGIKIYTADKDDENTLLRFYCDRMVDNLSKYLHL